MPLSYADTQAILAALRGDMKRMVAEEARKQTGVVAGYYTSANIGVNEFGDVTYAASGGGGSSLYAVYRVNSDYNIPNTGVLTKVNFQSRIYDRDWEAGGSGYVTTGSNWVFTAPTAGWYLLHAQIAMRVADSTDWLTGDIADLYVGTTGATGFVYRFTQTALTANTQQNFHMSGFNAVNLSAAGTAAVWVSQDSDIDRKAIATESRVAIWKA